MLFVLKMTGANHWRFGIRHFPWNHFFIFFGKKYALINGFAAAFREGRKTERYARRVGLVEFILGILLLIASVILILFIS